MGALGLLLRTRMTYPARMDDLCLRAEPIATPRLQLEPLRSEHAIEAAAAFDDIALDSFTGGAPATVEALRSRYESQVVGHSLDGTQAWLNWMLRRVDNDELIGTVQATVSHPENQRISAELAWVVSTRHQGNGYAREAAVAVDTWLRQRDVGSILAHIHPAHEASGGVARALGLRRTNTVVDGEERWVNERGQMTPLGAVQ